ncbi:heterokaryon incompatibility protein-domain-containing protein, partial [Bisporella sp. PMI_857]
MRLLHTQTLTLHKFPPDRIPPYAILSHTWGKDEDEVKLQDLETPGVTRKAGYAKIEGCCRQAREDKLEYAWVDTCCIDKTSSVELSEAINSMFRWYKNANVCYAYLADVLSSSDPNDLVSFKSSKWFTRGWTLQELIAPRNIVFYTKEWTKLGTKIELRLRISAVTSIHCDILSGKKAPKNVSIADRMSWVSRRFTTQPEDIAYCVLGIFDVNMPLLYGEGQKAFIRLQEEIIKVSDDHSIFAWTPVPGHFNSSMLALSPHMFGNIGSIVRYREDVSNEPFTMTNNGLRIELPILSG